MINFKIVLKTLKITNYKKNIVILFPVLFSGTIFSIKLNELTNLLIALISFSLLTSLVYIMNDLFDKEVDKFHPVKKYRPIASGEISNGAIVVIVLTVLSINFLLFVNFNILKEVSVLFSIYFINNVFYNLYLKKINIFVSSLVISIGFYLRLLIGAKIIGIELTIWLSLFVIVSTYMISYLKKLYDNETYSPEIISMNNKYFSLIFSAVIFGIYLIHLNSYELFKINFILVSNIFLFAYSVLLVIRFFIDNKGPKDPVELFGFNYSTFIFILWFISYFELRFTII